MRSLVAAACLALGLVVPTTAEAVDGIVLTGRTTAWVDVTIPREAGPVSLADAVVETKGRFGGVYAQQRTRANGPSGQPPMNGGVVVLRDLRATGQPARPVQLGLPSVEPGVVRFYLLADGPTTVRVRTSSAFGVRLTPKNAVRAQAVTGPLAPDGDALAGTAPVTLRQRELVLLALLAEAPGAKAADAQSCVSRTPGPCTDAPLLRRVGGDEAGGDGVVWAVVYASAALPPGRNVVRHRVTHVLPLKRAVGAALVLELG